MLSRSEVREFFERGYLRMPAVYDARALHRMGAAFSRLEARAQELDSSQVVNGSLFVIERADAGALKIERIVWCGGAEPVLAELGRLPVLLEGVAQLLGVPVVDQLINQAHIKRPGDGVEFFFHQDSYHRRYGTELFHDINGRGSFVQALSALDPMGPENGGLWLIPGSHQVGHIETSDGRLPEASFDASAAVPVRLAPGDTLLLSPFTVHGSKANSGTAPRRLFINGFCCPDANRREYPGAGRGLRLNVFDEVRTYERVV